MPLPAGWSFQNAYEGMQDAGQIADPASFGLNPNGIQWGAGTGPDLMDAGGRAWMARGANDVFGSNQQDINGTNYVPRDVATDPSITHNLPGFADLMRGAMYPLAAFGLGQFGSALAGGDSLVGNLFNGSSGATAGGGSMAGDFGAGLAEGTSGGFDMMGSGSSMMNAVNGTGGFDIQDLIKKLMGGGNPMGGASSLAQLAQKLFGGPNKQVGGIGDIIAGLYGASQSGKFSNLAGPGQAAAVQLQNLTNNPSAITSLPGYDALSKAREMAVSRRMAAQGYNMSGNEKTALADAGGQQFMEFRNAELDRLTRLASGGLAPQTAATTLNSGNINRVLYGAGNLVS